MFKSIRGEWDGVRSIAASRTLNYLSYGDELDGMTDYVDGLSIENPIKKTARAGGGSARDLQDFSLSGKGYS